MRTSIKSLLKSDPSLNAIHVDRNYLSSNRDPKTISKIFIDIAKNSNNDKYEILISHIVLPRDNLNGKRFPD